jgi:hypothetical protein
MRKRSNRKSDDRLIKIIREEYSRRLLNVYRESVRDLLEVDAVDTFGNVIISKGLKVRHKKSGYEYTVDHVEGEGDEMTITLRSPESPRFKPPQSQATLAEADETGDPDMDRVKVDQVDLQKISSKSSAEEFGLEDAEGANITIKTIKISRKELEKEYEVK